MNPDDLDRWLKGDGAIVPSSGFTSRVMEAVGREAAEPRALAFPWKFALPGIGVALAVAAASVFLVVGAGMPAADRANPWADALSGMIARAATSAEAGALLLAAVASVLPLLLSLRFTRARA